MRRPAPDLRLVLSRPRPSVRDRRGRRERIGLTGVLADLDRTGEACPVPGEAAVDGFTWDAHDRDDAAWMPQGVACLRGGDVLLVSWYGRRRGLRTGGARVTVVDRTDPARPRYRHVRLVVPRGTAGLRRLAPVPVHAGGIAVLGDLLLVADTFAGVRLFRLDDVLRLPGGDVVLPQWRALRAPGSRRPGGLRWSFLSVGEVDGRLSLVAGEYRRAGSRPRLVRYALDPATGLPPSGAGPVELHEDAPVRMQGVAVHGGTWYLSASAGEGNPGDLHVGRPGAWRRHRGVLPTGPEDLDWARPGEQLWCVTEWPGRRWVFRLDASRWASG